MSINNLRMYVCGPTIYDMFHLGNARTFIFFDIIFRLSNYIYPFTTQIRNITDIDDKIIHKLNNTSIELFLSKAIVNFYTDLHSLSCLLPSFQPRVSYNIFEIIFIIKKLINNKYAYKKNGNIYLNIFKSSTFFYLKKNIKSKRFFNLFYYLYEYKKNCIDFTLWKYKKVLQQIYFASPWGNGRPGWHISCISISKKYLGNSFDIHGGGIDLFSIHHKNEIIQNSFLSSLQLSSYWIHCNLVIINYNKMAKTLKNFFTIRELIFYGVEVMSLRYLYINIHYRTKLIFNNKILTYSKKNFYKFKFCLDIFPIKYKKRVYLPYKFLYYILNDINSSISLFYLHRLSNQALSGNINSLYILFSCLIFLGFNFLSKFSSLKLFSKKVIFLSNKRIFLRRNQEFCFADCLRKKINILGYNVLDYKYGYNLFIL